MVMPSMISMMTSYVTTDTLLLVKLSNGANSSAAKLIKDFLY